MTIRHPFLLMYRALAIGSFFIFPLLFMVIRWQFTVDQSLIIIFFVSCIVAFIMSTQLLMRFDDQRFAFTGFGIHLFLLFLISCY